MESREIVGDSIEPSCGSGRYGWSLSRRICAVLAEQSTPIAATTSYGHRNRWPSRAAQRDVMLRAEIERVWQANYAVYGARKVSLRLNREGIAVARCTVERLMRDMGLQGARRGRRRRTTVSDPAEPTSATPNATTPPSGPTASTGTPQA